MRYQKFLFFTLMTVLLVLVPVLGQTTYTTSIVYPFEYEVITDVKAVSPTRPVYSFSYVCDYGLSIFYSGTDYMNYTRIITVYKGSLIEVKQMSRYDWGIIRLICRAPTSELYLNVTYEQLPYKIRVETNYPHLINYTLSGNTLYIYGTNLPSTSDIYITLYDIALVRLEARDYTGRLVDVAALVLNGTRYDVVNNTIEVPVGDYTIDDTVLPPGYAYSYVIIEGNKTTMLKVCKSYIEVLIHVKVATKITDVKVSVENATETTINVRISGKLVDKYENPCPGKVLKVLLRGLETGTTYISSVTTYSDGTFNLYLENINRESYDVSITFDGDEDLIASSYSTTIKVKPLQKPITLPPEAVPYLTIISIIACIIFGTVLVRQTIKILMKRKKFWMRKE